MPDLLRAYGEILGRPDRGVTFVFCVLAAGVTALVLLFALGDAIGRVRRAWSRARSRRRSDEHAPIVNDLHLDHCDAGVGGLETRRNEPHAP
jgi:hypothetical protein